MNFWFKDTRKDIIMTKQEKENLKLLLFVNFVKKIIDIKVRDHCHLTGKYRGPKQNTCNINVQQKDSHFFSVILHNFSNYDFHLFFKQLADKKKDEVEFKVIPKTSEKYISIRYGCARFIDSFRFLSSSLGILVETLVDNSHKSQKNLKKKKL